MLNQNCTCRQPEKCCKKEKRKKKNEKRKKKKEKRKKKKEKRKKKKEEWEEYDLNLLLLLSIMKDYKDRQLIGENVAVQG